MKVQTYPGGKIYARTFPGFAFSWTFKAEAFKLAKALTKAQVGGATAAGPGSSARLLTGWRVHHQVSIHEGLFAAAVYDPPFKFFHRRNEARTVKSPLPSCAVAPSPPHGLTWVPPAGLVRPAAHERHSNLGGGRHADHQQPPAAGGPAGDDDLRLTAPQQAQGPPCTSLSRPDRDPSSLAASTVRGAPCTSTSVCCRVA